jgi:hypothetical protein
MRDFLYSEIGIFYEQSNIAVDYVRETARATSVDVELLSNAPPSLKSNLF